MTKQFLRMAITFILAAAFILTPPGKLLGTVAYAADVIGLHSAYGQGDDVGIEYTADTDKGVLTVCVTGAKQDVSIGLTEGDQTYNYRLRSGEEASAPFNMGNGDYDMEVRLYVQGQSAEPVWRTRLNINLKDEYAPWLSSSRIVNWSEDD